ncbi:hypothetical protein [Streptomyces sp. NPDC051776]|uniref:hypothetical protein n=1 Tax=Streptomyces sp. NPDC051776 TaxID=3155414 RepID=UPI003431C621
MGRHRRPTPIQHAHSSALRTAVALGAAGSIAFVIHSTAGDDAPVQARPGLDSRQGGTPGDEPTAADTTPAHPALKPTHSAEPELLQDRGYGAGAERTASQASDDAGTPTAAATPVTAPSSAPAAERPATPKSGTSSQATKSPGTGRATATDESAGRQQDDGGQDRGPVNGVVDGVGGTLDTVIGDLTDGLPGN